MKSLRLLVKWNGQNDMGSNVCRMTLSDGSVIRVPKRFMDWWRSTPVREREPAFMREQLEWYRRMDND